MLLRVILFLDDERDGMLPDQGQLAALDRRDNKSLLMACFTACSLTHPLWRESLKALAEFEHEEKLFRLSCTLFA